MAEADKDTTQDRFQPDDVIAARRNRQLMVVTVVILVLAGLIAVTRMTSGEVERLSEVPVVGEEPGFEPEDVHRVVMRKGGQDDIELQRRGDGWVLPGTFNHPAEESAAQSLVQRVFDATRFNRPVTTDEERFIRYRLDDENGVNLILMNERGDKIVHLVVGTSESGTRDFIRYIGDDAPDGVFELGGLGGHFQTLHSALLLGGDDELRPRSWLDLARFRPLSAGMDVSEVRVRNGDANLAFRRTDDDEWKMTEPGVGAADATRVGGIVNAMENLRASDVAGTTENTPSGTSPADREVAVSYPQGEDMNTVRVHFGETSNDRVAVRLDGDEFVYWTDDGSLDDIFRSASDFMKRDRLALLPTDLAVQSIQVMDDAEDMSLHRDTEDTAGGWTMTRPYAQEAVFREVRTLLRELDGLEGYKAAEADPEVLGLADPSRRIAIRVPAGDGELRTDTLAFGSVDAGDVAVRLTAGDREEYFRVSEDAVSRLFRPARAYIEPVAMDVLPDGVNLDRISIHDGDAVTTLEQQVDDAQPPSWTMSAPQQADADFDQAMALVRRLNSLEGLAAADEEVDREALRLGEDLSERRIVITWPDAEGGEEAATLYFGNRIDDDVPVLLARGDREAVYWLPWFELHRLFHPHVHYLPMPDSYEARVVHVLVTWQGKNSRATPRDANRTESEAWKLAEKVREEARAGADFEELQKQFSEEGAGSMVFEVNESAKLAESFKRLSVRLQPGEVDFVESEFGIHIIKRIE